MCTRLSVHRLFAAIALASIAALPAAASAAAQVKATSAVQAPLLRARTETAATDAFRRGTQAVARPPIPYQYPQSIQLQWSPYPNAAGYQIVRSWNATGPWAAATTTALPAKSTFQIVQGLLPDRTLYFRVVALGRLNKAVVALDSSNAAVVHTAGIVANYPTTSMPGFVHIIGCSAAPQAQVKLIWHSVPGAPGYQIIQGIDPRPAGGVPNKALPGEAETQQVASIMVRDTVFSQSSVPAGRYVYAVVPLFRMLNDTVEVPESLMFGAAVRFDLMSPTHGCG